MKMKTKIKLKQDRNQTERNRINIWNSKEPSGRDMLGVPEAIMSTQYQGGKSREPEKRKEAHKKQKQHGTTAALSCFRNSSCSHAAIQSCSHLQLDSSPAPSNVQLVKAPCCAVNAACISESASHLTLQILAYPLVAIHLHALQVIGECWGLDGSLHLQS